MASSNIKVTVTNAGISAMLNAQKTGTEKITITNCKFFSTYKAVSAETTAEDLAKLTKVADLDAVGGEQTSKNTIHVDAADSSANAYEVRTVGIYTSAGVLFAVTSSETSILEKVTQSIAMFAADIIIANADVSVLEFDNPSFTTAAATNANAGVIRIATDSEAVAATDGTIALVPSSLNALTANPEWRTYSNKLNYSIGAVCFYAGKLYVAIAANGPASAVKAPTDGAYWQQIPNLKNVTDTCVTLNTAQTIKGAKTFSAVTKSATPAASAKGTEVVTAAWTNSKIASALPAGSIIPFAGSNIPAGYLLCNGAAVSRTTYANLFSVISTLYGAGDGSTTFNLPDLRDRFLEGAGTNAVGTKLEAGLPNSTGGITPIASSLLGIAQGGALSWGKSSSRYSETQPNEQVVYSELEFHANNSNSIYSASQTVQPQAICFQYLIKY